MPDSPLSPLAAIAESQIGTEEDSAHTNRGAAIAKYQAATSLGGQGWPWCAAFVCWCVWQFLLQFASRTALPISHRPEEASVLGFEDWAIANGCLTFTDPKDARRGDFVTFKFTAGHHIAIVTANDANGHFETVEGNTNPGGGRDGYEVAHRVDRWQNPQAIRLFIRLPDAPKC